MTTPGRIIVLVDDVRVFRDGRQTHIARTPGQAIEVLTRLSGRRVDELWLDYDLFHVAIEPVVDLLIERAAVGAPFDIGQILVHSARTVEAVRVTTRLKAAGYPIQRNYSAGIWIRNPNPNASEGLYS